MTEMCMKCGVSKAYDSMHMYITLGSLHVYMHLMSACNWAVIPITEVCMKMCSKSIV